MSDDFQNLRDDLVNDEGIVLHAYQDHLGYWTIGVGRLIDERKGGGISRGEAMMLLDNDIARIYARLKREWSYIDELDKVRRDAVLNIAFQHGVAGLLRFERMLQALETGDYVVAAAEARDSKTWRDPATHARMERNARRIEAGGR